MSTRSAGRGEPPEHGARVAAPEAPRPQRRIPWIDRTIEGCWLAVAAFLPIFIMPETLTVGFVQVPKEFLLRSATLLAVALLAVEWAMHRRDGRTMSDDVAAARLWLRDIWTHAKRAPIVASAIGVLLVTVLSAFLSPMRIISIEGTRPGWDTYGLYNVAPFVVMFGLVASRMRTKSQFERLVWALTGASMLLGLYGIGQHFGIDPFRLSHAPKVRVTLSLGNPIFAASWLLMTIPLTLAMWQEKRNEMGMVEHVLLGAGLLALQVTTFLFTLARGGFLGLGLALAVFAGVAVWQLGKQAIYRPAASLAIAGAFALIVTLVPVPGTSSGTTGEVIDRFGSIAPQIAGGGLSDRYNIWRVAADAYFHNVWPDHSQYPEIPGIIAEPVRPLIGYGPDMFGYVYNVVGDSALQVPPVAAHNFPIQIAIELGLFGLIGYGALVFFVGLALWRLLRASKRGETPEWVTYLLLGAAAVFWGRLLEQMGGKAQIGDLSLSWIYAGAVVALVRMHSGGWPSEAALNGAPAPARLQTSRRRRQRPAQATTMSVPHVVFAAVVSIGAIAFWWQAVGSTALAASLTGRALIASVNGDGVTATRLMDDAVSISGKNYTPRYVLAVSWESLASNTTDAQTRGQYLLNALNFLKPVLDRDPMSRQAIIENANILRQLSALNPDQYAPLMLREWEVTLRLMPGLWDAEQLAAAAFIDYREAARGLEVVQTMRSQGAEGHVAPNVLDFLQAKALLRLGRKDEAQQYIDAISASTADNKQAMLADLAATQPQ